MKKYFLIVGLLLSFGVTMFLSCDKIGPPYMNVPDVTDCPVPDFPDVILPHKTVLIEEFTAHKCIYCPTGAYYIHQIQQSCGDSVIVLSIHARGLADPETGNFSLDLRPDDHGDELYSYFNIPSEPRAGFNREKLDGTNIFYGTPTTWQAKVEQVLAETPVMTIQIINNYDSATRKLCTHIRTNFLAASAQNLKIAVYISEDSIVGYQSNNNSVVGATPEIPDYVFMDVMRDEFVGTFGELLTSGGVAQDSSVIRTYKKILNPLWIAKNCKVVAYVYDTDTEAILQAAEQKVY